MYPDRDRQTVAFAPAFRENNVLRSPFSNESLNNAIAISGLDPFLEHPDVFPGLHDRKQSEVLAGQSHLVEIDLLRGGEHTTAVPPARLRQKTGPFDYHVCVHRYDNLEDFFVYPIQIEQRLPAIKIPLLPGDGEIEIELQAIFDRCYDAGPYRRRIRYDEAPLVPALPDAKLAWVRQRLAAAKVG